MNNSLNMKPFLLFLDDLRRPEDAYAPGVRRKDLGTVETTSLLDLTNTKSDDWVIVRTYEEFGLMLNSEGIPEIVSFDHDLSVEHIKYYFKETVLSGIIEYANLKHKTGWHCAKLLVQKCKELGCPLPQWFVHSANSYGSYNIKEVLENF